MRRLLAVAAFLAVLPAAQADRLDSRLLEEAPRLVGKLKAKKYANVGVLRFKVAAPGRKAGYSLPLSGNLVKRIETGLIIYVDQEGKPAMGVIRDAGLAALKKKTGGLATAAERRKLFGIEYPLAWGRDKVKADVFLTGTVQVSKDYKKAAVTIQSFDKADPSRLVTLASFTVPADRDLYRDLGMSFALPRGVRARAIKVKAADSEVDDAIETVVVNDPANSDPPPVPDKPIDPEKPVDPVKPAVKPDTESEPSNVGGIEIQLLADGKAVAFKKAAAGEPIKWQTTSPAPGQVVAFRLANKSDRKLGVVLRINGANIVNMQTHTPETCGKVILEPGKATVLKGFYMIEGATARAIRKSDDDPKPEDPKPEDPKPEDPKPAGKKKITLVPFMVIAGKDASDARLDLGDKAGLIEADVFEIGSAQPRGKVNQRGLPPSKDKLARETYRGLRTALLQSSGLKVKISPPPAPGIRARELIVARPDAEREEVTGSVADFPNPLFVARVAIRVVPAESPPVISGD